MKKSVFMLLFGLFVACILLINTWNEISPVHRALICVLMTLTIVHASIGMASIIADYKDNKKRGNKALDNGG